MAREPDYLTEALEAFPPTFRFVGRIDVGESRMVGVPEGVAFVAVVAKGSCLAPHRDRREPIRLSVGDVLLLSPGADHQLVFGPLSNDPTPLPYPEWVASARNTNPLLLSLSGGEDALGVSLVGGLLEFDDPGVHPFVWTLPPLIHLTEREVGQSVHLDGVRRSLESEIESESPGRIMLIRRFVEILLIETIRLGIGTVDNFDENPMGRLLDPDLGPALDLMHRQPEKSWTIAELAEHVAMSRSAFAAAFTEALGRPPVRYLRERRMVLAGRLLRDRALGLKEVAMRVGYDSVSAFNSAFRRQWGVAPGRFRAEASDRRLTLQANEARESKVPPGR